MSKNSLALRLANHIKEVQNGYVERSTSQLLAVMQRLSLNRSKLRTSMRATEQDTALPESADYEMLCLVINKDIQLLGDVLAELHSKYYLPLVALRREAEACDPAEPWLRPIINFEKCLFADLTLRESIVSDLGPSADRLLEVPKESMQMYIQSVMAHPNLQTDLGGCQFKNIIELLG